MQNPLKDIDGASKPEENTSNDQMRENKTKSKTKKDEKNSPSKCSTCPKKKRNKSILKSCIPHRFSVSVKLRSISVQTSATMLRNYNLNIQSNKNDQNSENSLCECSPPLDEKQNISKKVYKSLETSPKKGTANDESKEDEYTREAVNKDDTSFNEYPAYSSVSRPVDTYSDNPSKEDDQTIPNTRNNEISLCEDCPPCSNEMRQSSSQTTASILSKNNSNIYSNINGPEITKSGNSEHSLCIDCPPCSSEVENFSSNISDRLKGTSAEMTESLPQDNISNIQSKYDEPELQNTETTEITSTTDLNEPYDIADKLSGKSKSFSSETNTDIQSKKDETENPSMENSENSSNVDYPEWNDLTKKHSGHLEVMSAEAIPSESLIIKSVAQLEKYKTKTPNIGNSETSSCIDCPPCSNEVKNITNKNSSKVKRSVTQTSTLLQVNINSKVQSKRNVKEIRKTGSSENSLCFDCLPCSNDVNNVAIKSSDKLKNIFSETNESIAEDNIPKIQLKEHELQSLNTEEKENSLVIDHPTHSNEGNNISKKDSEKLNKISTEKSPSLAKDINLNIQLKEDKTEKQYIENSENSFCVDCPPCTDGMEYVINNKFNDYSLEPSASIPSYISSNIQSKSYETDKVNPPNSKNSSISGSPPRSSEENNIKENKFERVKSLSANTSALLPIDINSNTQSEENNIEKPYIENSDNSFCVDCPPCTNVKKSLEQLGEYSLEISPSIKTYISSNIQSESYETEKRNLQNSKNSSIVDHPPLLNEENNIEKKDSDQLKSISSEISALLAVNTSSMAESKEKIEKILNSEKSVNSTLSDNPPQPNEMSNIKKQFSDKEHNINTETTTAILIKINQKVPSSDEQDNQKTENIERTSPSNSLKEFENMVKKPSDQLRSISAESIASMSMKTSENISEKPSDKLQTISSETGKSTSGNIQSKSGSKEIEIKISKTENSGNHLHDTHALRPDEVHSIVVSILDSCTSKIFSSSNELHSICEETPIDDKIQLRNIIPEEAYRSTVGTEELKKEEINNDEEYIIATECIDFYLNLVIERFKIKAFDVDDEEFERMFEELKTELDEFFCQCGKIKPEFFTKSLSNAKIDTEGDSNTKHKEPPTKYINEEELKEMFDEMKTSLESKLCSCRKASYSMSHTSQKKLSNIDTREIGNSKSDDIRKISVDNNNSVDQNKFENLSDEYEFVENIDKVEITQLNQPTNVVETGDTKILEIEDENKSSEMPVLPMVSGDIVISSSNQNIDKANEYLENIDHDEIKHLNYTIDKDETGTNSETIEEIENPVNENSEMKDEENIIEDHVDQIAHKELNDDNEFLDNIDHDNMKQLNYPGDKDVMGDMRESIDRNTKETEQEDLKGQNNSEIFKTHVDPSISHETDQVRYQNLNDDEKTLENINDDKQLNYPTSEDAMGDIHDNIDENAENTKHENLEIEENNEFKTRVLPIVLSDSSSTSAKQKPNLDLNEDEDMKDMDKSLERSTTETENDEKEDKKAFNTHISSIVFRDKVTATVDQQRSKNSNETLQNGSSGIYESHQHLKARYREVNSTITKNTKFSEPKQRIYLNEVDDEFFSATECTNIYEDGKTYLTLVDEAVMNPMRLSELFPHQIQIPLLSQHSSTPESFLTAECPYYEVSKVSTIYTQRLIPLQNQYKCDKQVGTREYTAKSRAYKAGRIFSVEPDGEEVAQVAINREKTDGKENLDKIKVRIRLTDERNTKKKQSLKGSEMSINKSQKFSRSFVDFNVKYETTKEKIVEEPKVVTEGSNIKIFIPLETDNLDGDQN